MSRDKTKNNVIKKNLEDSASTNNIKKETKFETDKEEIVVKESDISKSNDILLKTENKTEDIDKKTAKKEAIKKNVKSMSIEILTILIGTFVMALGFQIFLTPHKIVPGGFMGLAQIVHDIVAKTGFTFISTYAWYIILNAFLYIYAVKCLGWKFGIRAGVGIFSFAIFGIIIENTNLVDPITEMIKTEAATSYILYAIYGGVLMGSGIGLVFRGNGSTGGCDMVALVVNKFFPTVTTGQIIMFVDGTVVVLSVIAYGSLVLPLYALITIFISGRVSDMFVDGIRSLRAYYVVTDKKEELSQAVFNKLNRGVTNLKCEGMFTHNDRDMLLIIVRRSQIISLKKIVKRIDPNSFMFSHNVKEAYGNGFIAYSNDKIKKNKKFKNINQEQNIVDNNVQNLEDKNNLKTINPKNEIIENNDKENLKVENKAKVKKTNLNKDNINKTNKNNKNLNNKKAIKSE